MYIIGGAVPTEITMLTVSSNPSPLNNISIFDTLLNTWSNQITTGPIPTNRNGHSALLTSDGNTIVVFGGGHSATTWWNDVWALDVNQFSWTQPQVSGT